MGYMVLTQSGHIALARAMMAQDMWMAWGDLPPFLAKPTNVTGVASPGGSLMTGSKDYYVTAYNGNGETDPSAKFTFTTAVDSVKNALSWNIVNGAAGYRVYGGAGSQLLADVQTNSWTDTGSAPLSSVITVPSVNTTSATPWTSVTPNPSGNATQIFEELGRRKVLLKKYVTPDVNGPYTTSQGTWSESAVPTRYLYLYVSFDLTDAQAATIYQFGLYVGTTPIAGQEGANYLLPNQINDPGSLLSIENVQPIIRNASTREISEVVVTF